MLAPAQWTPPVFSLLGHIVFIQINWIICRLLCLPPFFIAHFHAHLTRRAFTHLRVSFSLLRLRSRASFVQCGRIKVRVQFYACVLLFFLYYWECTTTSPAIAAASFRLRSLSRCLGVFCGLSTANNLCGSSLASWLTGWLCVGDTVVVGDVSCEHACDTFG